MIPTVGDQPGWRLLLRVSSTTWLGELAESEGVFWTGDDAGPRRPVDLDVPVGCLPLLERPYRDVREDCDRLLPAVGTSTRRALGHLVPGGLVEAALHVGSDYWLGAACAWLDAGGGSEQVAAWAGRIEEAPGATQPTRHAARRIRRSWRRDA